MRLSRNMLYAVGEFKLANHLAIFAAISYTDL